MVKRTEVAAVLLLMLGLFAVSSAVTGAFLTDRPMQLSNLITLGDIKVKLSEPQWEDEKGKDLLPLTAVPKNPVAANTGKTDAWMFLEVSVPVKNIRLVDPQSKRKQEPSPAELFDFTPGPGWELAEKSELPEEAVYVYGYRTLVGPGEMTQPLFEKVTLVNYLEGEVTAEDKLEMPVKAIAVQSGISADETDPAQIYRNYLEQEGAA